MNLDVDTYALVLNQSADMLDALNKKKNNPDVAELSNQLRDIAKTLKDEQLNKEQKSVNLAVKLFNYIKSKLGA